MVYPIYIFVSVRPALRWLVSSIGRALHGYHRGQGFESRTSLLAEVSHVRDLLAGKSRTSLVFFPGFLFANVTATQVNCDDLLSFACIYIHNFIAQLMHYKCNSKFNSMFALNRFSDTFHLFVPKHLLFPLICSPIYKPPPLDYKPTQTPL